MGMEVGVNMFIGMESRNKYNKKMSTMVLYRGKAYILVERI